MSLTLLVDPYLRGPAEVWVWHCWLIHICVVPPRYEFDLMEMFLKLLVTIFNAFQSQDFLHDYMVLLRQQNGVDATARESSEISESLRCVFLIFWVYFQKIVYRSICEIYFSSVRVWPINEGFTTVHKFMEILLDRNKDTTVFFFAGGWKPTNFIIHLSFCSFQRNWFFIFLTLTCKWRFCVIFYISRSNVSHSFYRKQRRVPFVIKK